MPPENNDKSWDVIDLVDLVNSLGPDIERGINENTTIVDNPDGSQTVQIYETKIGSQGDLRNVVTITIKDTANT